MSSDAGVRQLLAQISAAKGIPDLAKAFCAAWGEVPNVVKNANNPHFGNDYADLSAVLDVIKPVFARHKLAIIQGPGPMNGDKVTVQNILLHESGQHVSFTTELPIGNKPTAQAAGSAYTYARRYAAQAIAGIAPVDDDGEQASAEPPKKTVKRMDAPGPDIKHPKETKEGSYAERKQALIDLLNAADSRENLERLKPEVQELGEKDVADVYVSRLREFKKAK